MNGKRLYLIAGLTVAVAMVLIIPVYAFTSSVSVNNNTVESTTRTVDITNQTTPFSVTPPEFGDLSDPESNPVWIRNHTFEITADGNVKIQAWLCFNDSSAWLILDHAELVIYNANLEVVYDVNFGEEATGSKRYQSTIPTVSMTLDPSITYKFDLAFHFKDLVGENLYNQYRGNFNGNITFAIADSTPAPIPAPNP